MPVQARCFNTIKVDKSKGTITKTSTDVKKFIDEINWYSKVPREVQYCIPRIFDSSVDAESSFITMEHYDYKTLHEVFIEEGKNRNLEFWTDVFKNLKDFTDKMKKYQPADLSNQREAISSMYLEKTTSRLRKCKELFGPLFEDKFIVNGVYYEGLQKELGTLYTPKVLSRLINCPTFNFIHGDLCFANVLVAPNTHALRVIDPRGSFGSYDVYGDPRYELAKILHSIDGNYDKIIEDQFKIIHLGERAFNFEIEQDTQLVDCFVKTFGISPEDFMDIKLIEALLFLSMIPLHSDYPNRQYAMLATGLSLLRSACL